MNIYEVSGLIVSVITIIGFMWSIKKDINYKFDLRFDNLENHMKHLENDMKDQGKRIDNLYSMFVDLVSKMK